MAYTAKDPHPPWCFLYLRETSWRCEEREGGEGEEEKVSLLTHVTARGMGKNLKLGSDTGGNSQTPPPCTDNALWKVGCSRHS